ncbi:MAG: ATP synthase F1 subunit delta [Bacillota bacterium]|nr:ATP synthase F1 subunit delta [Bacillota bacterium]
MAELVAKKYSQAIFEAAVEEDQLAEVVSEFRRFVPLFDEAKSVLLSPTVHLKEKMSLIEVMQLEGLMRSFAFLLLEKDRLAILHEIKLHFDRMVEEHEKTATAYITTAVSPDDRQIEMLREKLEHSTGLKINIVSEVDARLIGGVVIRIGDKVLDGSVRKKLENMLESIREIK